MQGEWGIGKDAGASGRSDAAITSPHRGREGDGGFPSPSQKMLFLGWCGGWGCGG